MDSDLGTAFKYMLKPYRFTLQMPACVTICTTGWAEPEVNGSNWPSARVCKTAR
jgi:hypothetical protein